jgi:hypothetical protein
MSGHVLCKSYLITAKKREEGIQGKLLISIKILSALLSHVLLLCNVFVSVSCRHLKFKTRANCYLLSVLFPPLHLITQVVELKHFGLFSYLTSHSRVVTKLYLILESTVLSLSVSI